MRRIVLLAVLAAAAACTDAEEPSTRVESEVSSRSEEPAETEPSEEPPPVLPGDPSEHLSPELADKYARVYSKGDDWDTERVNDQIGRDFWFLITGLVMGNDGLLEQVGGNVSTSLRPTSLETLFEDETFVVRGGEIDPTAAKPFPEAVADLLAPFEGEVGGASGHASRITIDGDVVTSVIRYHAFGKVEQHALWTTTWKLDERGRPDHLLSLEVSDFVEIHPKNGSALFDDVTEAALGANASFERQLMVGLDHWSGALDTLLGVSVIGHEGLALGDVNGDHLDDLYVCQPGGLPNLLFVRNADGTATDVSREAGVDWLDASRSALFVDLDGDGDQDLVVEADPVLLLMENDGAGHFALKAEAPAPSTTSLSAIDADLDGDLDLYACGYMLPDAEERIPIPYHDANNGRPNTYLRNDSAEGEWVFTDATVEVGLDRNNRRYSFAATWEDYDGDGDPDLYVANDFGRNNLYRNDGGTFVDVAAEAGVEDISAGMGVAWEDADLDGKTDLYVSNMYSSAGGRITYQRRFQAAADDAVRATFQRHARGNTFFRNLGDGTFADVSVESGTTMGRWAWGAIFTDFQNDGLPDLVVPNGFVTGADPADL